MARTVSIDLHKNSFETYNCDAPSLEVKLPKEELVRMYQSMVVMRRMEMASDGLYKAKLIRGFCHLCTGQVNTSYNLAGDFITIFYSRGKCGVASRG